MSNIDSTIANELKQLKHLGVSSAAQEKFINQYFKPTPRLTNSTWFRLAFVFLCMFLSGSAVMTAAEKSKPGEFFYSVKKAIQQLVPPETTISPTPYIEQMASPTPTTMIQSETNTNLPSNSPELTTVSPTPLPSLIPTAVPSPVIQVELPILDIGIGGSSASPLPLPSNPNKLTIDLPVIPPFEVDVAPLPIGL